MYNSIPKLSERMNIVSDKWKNIILGVVDERWKLLCIQVWKKWNWEEIDYCDLFGWGGEYKWKYLLSSEILLLWVKCVCDRNLLDAA